MELRQLRYFAVLAEHLHYRRAAEALEIAQPTLSQQIVALEDELGARLFDRSKRSVRLTVAGTVFLGDVQTILAQAGLAANHVREAEAGRRGVLEIGSSGPPMSAYLPRVIRAFRAANPEITVNLRMMYSSDIREHLEQRRIHIGFGRGGMMSDELASRRLASFPYHVVLPNDHPQVQRKSVRLERLRGEKLITYPRALIGESYDQMLAFCHAKGFAPHAIEEVTDLGSVLGIVACGLGISILPFTGPFSAADVVTRPIAASDDWRFPIAAYWRIDGQSPLVAALLDVARAL